MKLNTLALAVCLAFAASSAWAEGSSDSGSNGDSGNSGNNGGSGGTYPSTEYAFIPEQVIGLQAESADQESTPIMAWVWNLLRMNIGARQ